MMVLIQGVSKVARGLMVVAMVAMATYTIYKSPINLKMTMFTE